MPDPGLSPSSPLVPKQLSTGAITNDDFSPNRYTPSRVVSVHIGVLSYESDSKDDDRVRIIILLDSTAKGELTMPLGKDARIAPFQGPSVLVVGARKSHAFRSTGSAQVVVLLAETRFVLETTAAELPKLTVADLVAMGHRDEVIAQLSGAFRAVCRGEKRPTSLYIDSIGAVVATHVLQDLFDGESPADRRGGLPTDMLHRVITYIDDHYAEKIDFNALARIVGLGRNQFQRRFKKSLNQAPKAYVRRRQIEHAVKLLQATDIKGVDIALACGFCDETQMARWFRKVRDCRPSEVRAAARR